MAKLPTAQSLGVRSFQDRSTVVTPSVDTRGQDALVSTISNISQGMNERLDASSLHKAKIHFQKAKLEADAAFDQDQDFETYQSRYDEKMKTAMASAGEMVRNPKDRERFSQDMSLYRAQGNQMMIAKAYGKEVDKGLADLDEVRTMSKENYLRSSNQDDKNFAVSTFNDAVNSAVDAGHIKPLQGQKLVQEQALGLAIASVEAADPEKALKLLNSDVGIMKDLPSEVRTKLIKTIELKFNAQKSMEMADSIREAGGTLDEKLKKVYAISDQKIRAATKQQVIGEHKLQETIEGQERYEIYSEIADGLIGGRYQPKDLNSFILEQPDKWEKLEPKEKLALEAMVKRGSPPKTVWSVYNELAELKLEDNEAAHKFFLKNQSSFSLADSKAETDYFNDPGSEPKQLLTVKEKLNLKLKDININPKKGLEAKGKARKMVEDDYNAWMKANPNKDMPADVQDYILNSSFDTAVEGGWLSFDKPGYELPKDEMDKIKLNKQFAKWEAVKGAQPTVDQKMLIEISMRKHGLIK